MRPLLDLPPLSFSTAAPVAAAGRSPVPAPRAAEGWQRRTRAVEVWGTVVLLDLRGPFLDGVADQALDDAVALLHRVDAWFSPFRPESPLARLRAGHVDLAGVPTVVRQVLTVCERVRDLTGGAFDPWAVPGGVDPSGYVKGWAAGCAADLVVAAGVPNVAVNAAGDVACRGMQAPGERWSVGILDPTDTERVVEVVRAGDGAVATSGLRVPGARLVNPRTGGAETWYDTATVVGPDAGLADALATACLVAGPEAAGWFADLPAWSAYLVRGGEVTFFGPAFMHLA